MSELEDVDLMSVLWEGAKEAGVSNRLSLRHLRIMAVRVRSALRSHSDASENLSVWSCTDFEGHWPVGVAAVVVAASPFDARELLRTALEEHGLPDTADRATLTPLDMNKPHASVLNDGNY